MKKKVHKYHLLKEMYKGVVRLKYKRNHEPEVEVNGTLVTAFIPYDSIRTSLPNPPGSNINHVVYWDVVRKKWESFFLTDLTEYHGLVNDQERESSKDS
ncbi:MAG: SH3 beta-barrel fold-containing protein [Candidatus Poseidoniales archaeon]